MSCKAIKLLADVGLIGNQDCFLVQPVRIKPSGCIKQDRDLLRDSCLDRLGTATRRGLRPGSKGGDFVHPLVKHAPQNLAFLPTHGGKLSKSMGKTSDDRTFSGT